MPENHLYFGDNLDVLRRHIPSESVDLIYLDPPFNSKATYNVLFSERDGSRSAAQINAFKDSWRWDEAAVQAYNESLASGGQIAEAVALHGLLGDSNLMAYIAMMTPRLAELHRALKPTGSIYLHCDPTASHYLKIIMDAIFGARRFAGEIVWKRSSAHSDTKQGRRLHGRIHDVILFYTRSAAWTWNPVYTAYDREYLKSEYRHIDPTTRRRYKETDVTGAKPGGDTEFEWRVKRKATLGNRWQPDLEDEYQNPKPGMEYKGVLPYNGRYWAYSKTNLMSFWRQGKLVHRKTGMPRLIQFADEMPGVPLQDLWTDIPPESGANDLGYPTQKPKALLERIIQASSNEGDTVLDPFCGCGTAIAVAHPLRRKWIGIDITYLAIDLIKRRLDDAFGREVRKTYDVTGEPTSLSEACALAGYDRYQFQLWALGLVDARPAGVQKGADRGIDGRLYFHDEDQGRQQTKQVILSVKSGGVGVKDVRDLNSVVGREALRSACSSRWKSQPGPCERKQQRQVSTFGHSAAVSFQRSKS